MEKGKNKDELKVIQPKNTLDDLNDLLMLMARRVVSPNTNAEKEIIRADAKALTNIAKASAEVARVQIKYLSADYESLPRLNRPNQLQIKK